MRGTILKLHDKLRNARKGNPTGQIKGRSDTQGGQFPVRGKRERNLPKVKKKGSKILALEKRKNKGEEKVTYITIPK